MTLRRSEGSLVASEPRVGISLLGGFRLTNGGEVVDLPPASQRLLAFLALRGREVRRTMAAGSLWPDSSEVRAHASLRSALARLHRATTGVVEASASEVGIAEGVVVDVVEARAAAYSLSESSAHAIDAEWARAVVADLSAELLPGWYDDWILLEAENWRQLRLHALETAARLLAGAGHFGDATGAALAAIAVDPLRETAHRALIRVHLAEGNRSEALGAFGRFRALLHAELGLEPTQQLAALVFDAEG